MLSVAFLAQIATKQTVLVDGWSCKRMLKKIQLEINYYLYELNYLNLITQIRVISKHGKTQLIPRSVVGCCWRS